MASNIIQLDTIRYNNQNTFDDQDEIIPQENEPVRTYLDYEKVGRKQLRQERFDWDYTDFDAEYSLGGRPDYDAWFPPQYVDFDYGY